MTALVDAMSFSLQLPLEADDTLSNTLRDRSIRFVFYLVAGRKGRCVWILKVRCSIAIVPGAIRGLTLSNALQVAGRCLAAR